MPTLTSAAALCLLLCSAAPAAGQAPIERAPVRSRPPTAGACGRARTAFPRTSRRPSPRPRTATCGSVRAAGSCASTASASRSSIRRTSRRSRATASTRSRRPATAPCGPAPRARVWSAIGTARSARSDAADGLTNLFVRALFEDREGRLWVGTDDGLFRLEGDSLRRIDGQGGAPTMYVHAICQDRGGRILVGGGGLLILDGDRVEHYRSAETFADNSIRTIRESRDGAVWIGTISGLRRLDGGVRGNPFAAPRIVDGTNISALYESPSGQMWIATYGRGLMRVDASGLATLRAPASLPHDNVLAVFEDGEENVWVGTHGGLLRLRRSAASTITTADGAPSSINTIYEDRDGSLLVAALNGRLVRGGTADPRAGEAAARPRDAADPQRLSRQQRTALDRHRRARRRPRRRHVHRPLHDEGRARQRLRPRVLRGCRRRRLDRHRRRRHPLARRRVPDVQAVDRPGLFEHPHAADRSHRHAVGRDRRRRELDSIGRSSSPTRILDRLRGLRVWALHEDAGGGMWIGTQGAGLFLFKDGALTQFTIAHGLPSNKIHFIGEDRAGLSLDERPERRRLGLARPTSRRCEGTRRDTWPCASTARPKG